MRLLPKQEVNDRLKESRRIEIDEGAKLARKIDTLRETALKEEANLTKFREESIKIVTEEIKKLIEKKETLLKEIELLTNK